MLMMQDDPQVPKDQLWWVAQEWYLTDFPPQEVADHQTPVFVLCFLCSS